MYNAALSTQWKVKMAAAAHWKEKDRNTNSSLHSHPVWLGMEKVTLDAKHNLNARFINNMEKVLLMLNTTFINNMEKVPLMLNTT